MKRRKAQGALLDLLLLLGVFSLTAFGVLGVRALLYGGPEDDPPASIVVRVEGVDETLAHGIQEGERVIDRTNRRLLGTIASVQTEPYVNEVSPREGTDALSAREPGRCNVYLTLLPDTDHGGYFVVPRVWRVGSSLTFSTPSFASVGTVISVRR